MTDEQLDAAIKEQARWLAQEFPEDCAICQLRPRVAGVYCQICLNNETEGMDSDTLFNFEPTS